jgi:putative glutamine amidotransferase
MSLRIGITMRVTKAKKYYDLRDSISQDWHRFLHNNFKNVDLIYIPNIKEGVIEYIKYWKVDSIIFSGGDDLGLTPSRYITERILLKYALKNKIPVMGICRGLQLIVSELGGEVSSGNKDFINRHNSKRHNVYIQNSLKEVNSFHSNQIKNNSLPKELDVLAYDEKDKSVEALIGDKIIALMWHPEREEEESLWQINLIKNHFGI